MRSSAFFKGELHSRIDAAPRHVTSVNHAATLSQDARRRLAARLACKRNGRSIGEVPGTCDDVGHRMTTSTPMTARSAFRQSISKTADAFCKRSFAAHVAHSKRACDGAGELRARPSELPLAGNVSDPAAGRISNVPLGCRSNFERIAPRLARGKSSPCNRLRRHRRAGTRRALARLASPRHAAGGRTTNIGGIA